MTTTKLAGLLVDVVRLTQAGGVAIYHTTTLGETLPYGGEPGGTVAAFKTRGLDVPPEILKQYEREWGMAYAGSAGGSAQ